MWWNEVSLRESFLCEKKHRLKIWNKTKLEKWAFAQGDPALPVCLCVEPTTVLNVSPQKLLVKTGFCGSTYRNKNLKTVLKKTNKPQDHGLALFELIVLIVQTLNSLRRWNLTKRWKTISNRFASYSSRFRNAKHKFLNFTKHARVSSCVSCFMHNPGIRIWVPSAQ